MSSATLSGGDYPDTWPIYPSLAGHALTEPAVLAHPNPYYRALRAQDPIHFDEALGAYIVSRYDDIQTVLRDAITFSQERGWKKQFARGHFDELKSILIRDGGGYFPELLLLDPPAHTRMRKLLQNAFTAPRIRDLEPRVRALIVGRIEAIADKGSADGVAEFAAPLTVSIICEQLGLPRDAAGNIPKWARAYSAQVTGLQTHDEMVANAQLICELQHFIIDCIRERSARREEDMISDLIFARLEEDKDANLTFEETVALTRGLLMAGNDTTTRALSQFLRIIATMPEVADHLYAVIDDDSEVNRFVEEMLRIAPPVRGLFRITTREVELGGKLLPEDSHVMVLFASGNDDDSVFACPRAFDAQRANGARHLSFGGGIHLCAGIALAKMELRITVREIMTRLKDIRLAIAEEAISYVPSPIIQAIESLPLTFSRRK
jgi:cytochrome P450